VRYLPSMPSVVTNALQDALTLAGTIRSVRPNKATLFVIGLLLLASTVFVPTTATGLIWMGLALPGMALIIYSCLWDRVVGAVE
jgi:hypothetical protein